ncbi:HpsJ family protein [Lyngbya confervoides]|uniref:HpsJ family protein n=1 Tax=Lyngbya confervoides BDU141951 TaxID=1574623 RepID=A0ABD4T4E2_9CYAN|nr:HpsJ family protein [Lyngbya confervoides]MCM1983392.1 HpsJ family protein [Lyngbya confervoides BDU141951]
MKTLEKNPLRDQGTLILGIIGTLLLLTYLFDFGIRLFTAQFENLTWQQNFLNELIDRGVTPLLGLVFIYIGTLFHSSTDATVPSQESPLKDGRFWLFVVSSLLGLLYLILIPFHFNTTGSILSSAIEQYDQEEGRAQQEIQLRQQQLSALASSDQADQILQNQQIPEAQKELLRQAKENPSVIEQRAQQELTNVQQQKAEAIKKANSEALVARLRAEFRSALLAVAFAVLGWTGLRNVLKG